MTPVQVAVSMGAPTSHMLWQIKPPQAGAQTPNLQRFVQQSASISQVLLEQPGMQTPSVQSPLQHSSAATQVSPASLQASPHWKKSGSQWPVQHCASVAQSSPSEKQVSLLQTPGAPGNVGTQTRPAQQGSFGPHGLASSPHAG